MLIILILILSLSLIFLNILFAPYLPNLPKSLGFECGFSGSYQNKESFHISFYIIGILFLLFDIEISFVYSVIISGNYYAHFIIFLILLSLGLIVERDIV